MTPAWLEYVRLVGRLRVDERRAAWRGRGAAALHGEVDDVLAGPEPAGGRPAELDAAWDALQADASWARLAGSFGLSRVEQELLALLAAGHADVRLRRVLGYL